MPFVPFRRDHLRPTSGIIYGLGSFEVQFEDHFGSEDHLRSRVSFAALYSANSHKVTIQVSFGSPVMLLKTRQGAVLKLCK